MTILGGIIYNNDSVFNHKEHKGLHNGHKGIL